MKYKALALATFLATTFSQELQASPWVGTIDKQLHYDVQTLAEWGYIDLAVTTYPIPWKGVAQQIEDLSPSDMSFRPQQALQRLKHYLTLHKRQQSRKFLTFQGATDDVRFRSLDDGVEEKAELTISTELYHERWSAQISVNYASGGRKNLDNSFIAYQFGDWNLRLGSIDQFWGPAQSSSLILSNNTRPVKTLALSRSQSTASEHPWLSWLGPWYFSSQFGQMESSRAVPDTKLLLNRFNARPFRGFEFGVSWAAMWGGDGQPEGFKEFFEVITFKGICQQADGDCSESGLTKRGNHLAGFDISFTTQLFARPVTFYAQRVGEDAVDYYRITDNANLFGVSTYIENAKVFLETSDTKVNCDGNATTNLNCYYENGDYPDGYRMYGRTLGSTFDSDAKQITLGANYRFEDGAIAELYIRSAELNKDGILPSPVLTESVSEDVLELSGFYQRPIGNWLLKAGGSIANRDLVESSETDALLYMKAQYAF